MSTTSASASFPRRQGGAIVYTVIVLFVLIGFVGLAIDWGYMTWTAQKLQNAADAAALAGAQEVWHSHSDARDAAINLAALNEAGSKPVTLNRNMSNNAKGDVVMGKYDIATKTFTATGDRTVTNAVLVVARRTTGSGAGPLPLFFGPIFSKKSADVSRYGIAVALGRPDWSSVLALNTKDPNSLHIFGSSTIDLGEGSIHVNSSSGQSTLFQGTNFTFVGSEVNIVGGYHEKGNANIENATDINPGEPALSDPLGSLPAPPFEPLRVPPSVITATNDGILRTYDPGYYPQGLRMTGGKVFLNPGIYILGNEGATHAFDTNGGDITGYEVMFYIAKGGVNHNGNGTVRLTPPQADLPGTPWVNESIYKGIQFFQARGNTSPSLLNGTGVFTGTALDVNSAAGAMYFPSATLTVSGTGVQYIDSFVADKIVMSGSGQKYVTRGYDDVKGDDPVYLVE